MLFKDIISKFKIKRDRKTERKRNGRWILLVILGCLVYLIAGALLPFMGHKESTAGKRDLYEELADKQKSGSVDRASILETNKDALDMRLFAISQAQERVAVSTFDIRPGESWDAMGSALLEAADRGVAVQILVDGAFGLIHMSQKADFYALGSHENVEIKYYNPVNLLKPWKLNGRLHDKYVLADDRYLILGGRNIFDYFLGEYEGRNKGYDRDIFVLNTACGEGKTKNSIIWELDDYFQKIWDNKECKIRFAKTPFYLKNKTAEYQSSYREVSWKKELAAITEKTVYNNTVPIEAAALIVNPTHVMNKEPWVWDELADLMEGADSRVLIQTPYAVFSDSMQDRLAEVVDRVPQVEMLLNGVAVGDNIMASSDYIKRRGDVLETGIFLREYQGDYSMHAKSVLIDDYISVIGSYNLDMRSTYIDTETMLVIQGEEFNQLLEEQMELYYQESVLVERDGCYEEQDEIEIKELSAGKERLLKFIAFFAPFFRNLI